MSDSICPNPQLQSPLNVSAKDKFIMLFELPYVLRERQKEDPSLNSKFIQLSIHGLVVPEISVPETDVRFQGQNLHLSTYARPSNPPLSVRFIVDNEYKNYYLLWRWLDTMNLSRENLYGGSSSSKSLDKTLLTGDQFEYQTSLTVLALNEYNIPVLQFNYTKCFISKLGGIEYSYRDGNILECSADFHFSQLTISNSPNLT